MHSSIILSCVLASLWAPVTWAKGPQALIWAGATSEEEAQELSHTWEVAAPILENAGVRPAEGYPKLVESKSVRGLKPGFWVWVVGYCEAGEASAVLESLKALYPGAYARDVKVPKDSLACPRHEGSGLRAESVNLKRRDGGVRVVSLEESSSPEGEEPGESYDRTRYYFVLTGPKGEPLGSNSAVGEEHFTGDPRNGYSEYTCALKGLRRDERQLLLTRKCRAPVSECGGLTSATEITTISVSGQQVETSMTREDEAFMECGD